MLYTFDKLEKFNTIKLSKDTNLFLKNIKEIIAEETNGYLLYLAWKSLKKFPNDAEELMYERFYKGSKERYEQLIKPYMKEIPKGKFMMGFHKGELYKYLGEEPLHAVTISNFSLSSIVVTEELYRMYDSTYKITTDQHMPAVNVSWYDAVMFCLWAGCRLPSEAEWEYACRSGSNGSWCCDEKELINYGWFSENSKGLLHPVAQLKANAFGIYDMHGNVWEWCQDSYEADYYQHSAKLNPINEKNIEDKVCRGGSIHAFGTMCGSAIRYNEPAYYFSSDTGFRVAKDVITQ